MEPVHQNALLDIAVGRGMRMKDAVTPNMTMAGEMSPGLGVSSLDGRKGCQRPEEEIRSQAKIKNTSEILTHHKNSIIEIVDRK
jgi:hypothetical protein